MAREMHGGAGAHERQEWDSRGSWASVPHVTESC